MKKTDQSSLDSMLKKFSDDFQKAFVERTEEDIAREFIAIGMMKMLEGDGLSIPKKKRKLK